MGWTSLVVYPLVRGRVGPLLFTDSVLSTSQIAALHTTPVTVVPASGVERAALPIAWSWVASAGTNWNPQGNAIQIGYASALFPVGADDPTAALSAGGARVYFALPIVPVTLQGNTAIVLKATGALISGTRTLTVRTYYRLVPAA